MKNNEFPPIVYARQIICDQASTVMGSELLYREAMPPNATPARFNASLATRRVLISAFGSGTAEQFTHACPAFINVTSTTLQEHLPFEPSRFVIEVPETLTPNPAVVRSLEALRADGCRIAIDGYAQPNARHWLLAHADIVKLEYPAFNPATLRRTVAALKTGFPDLVVLAEKIETGRDFAVCIAAGCDLFQGHHLAPPEPVYEAIASVDNEPLAHLRKQLAAPHVDLKAMSRLLDQNDGLRERVLALANTWQRESLPSMHSTLAAIESLGHARLRQFFDLLSAARLPATKSADRTERRVPIVATRNSRFLWPYSRHEFEVSVPASLLKAGHEITA